MAGMTAMTAACTRVVAASSASRSGRHCASRSGSGTDIGTVLYKQALLFDRAQDTSRRSRCDSLRDLGFARYLRDLTAARVSRSASRRLTVSRLSYSFFPFARLTAIFTRPFLK